MTPDTEPKSNFIELRRSAESTFAEKPRDAFDISTLSLEDVQKLVHELQVHQIELEMQNEELRRTQQELETSRNKYAELYDFAPLGYFVLDQTGLILEANLTGSGLLGKARSLLIGKPLASFVKEEDGDALYLHFRQVLETQSKQTCKIRFTRGDGSQIQARLDTLVLRNQDGSSPVLRTAVSDIKSREHTEEAYNASELRYRSLFESTRDGILILDFDTGKILDVNQHLIDMLGYPHEDYLEKCLWEISPFQDTALTATAFGELRQKGYAHHDDLSLQTRDGRGMHVEFFSNSYLISGMTFIQCHIRDITDRRLAKKLLQESEQNFAVAFRKSPVAMTITSAVSEKYVDVNEVFLRDTGYTREEVIGHTSEELHLFVDYEDRNRLIRLGQTESQCGTDMDLRMKSGEIGNCLIYTSLIETGGQPQCLASIVNITDRKKATDLIRVRMNLLEYSARHSFDELLQKTLDEVGSLTNSPIGFYHFISEDEKDISLQAWSTRTVKEFCQAERNERHYSVEQAGVWVDCIRERKTIVHNDYSSSPHRKGMPEGHAPVIREFVVPIMRSGRIVAVLGLGNKPTDYTEIDVEVASYLADVAWEISDRKRTEETLKERDKQYRKLFEDSMDGVYSVLRDGIITDANSSFCGLFASSREEIVGKDIRELYLDPADRLSFQKEIEEKGFVKDYEVKLRKRDGTRVDCLLTASVHYGKDGSIIGYRGIVRDLTLRKGLQRQLLQAQKMEAVGTLAGGVAHDFNNLLQVTLGYSELLLNNKSDDDPDYSDLWKIYQAAYSGSELVRNLLTFSRKAEPNPVPMNLNHHIRRVEKILRHTIPRMIEIQLELEEDLERINADHAQVEQVIMNLAVNARDAMSEEGKLTIRSGSVTLDDQYCRRHVGAKPGRYVLLSVSDTGQGMDVETMQHVFEPFFTTKELGRGTGLGLAMVYGIVKQHGGHITCHSEVGKGTTFKIYLPAIFGDQEDFAEPSGEMPASGTETVLFVDDEEFVREQGERILTRSGYKVLTAANGAEAVHLYRRQKDQISLIILDLVMPTMGGQYCLKRLLEIDPQTKVLIASGYSPDTSTIEVLGLAAKGFVTKPFRLNELLRQVRKALDAP